MIIGKFVERRNRFIALVEIDGEQVAAHVANSGRLRELLKPGNEVFLVRKKGLHRTTGYDLALVSAGNYLVSVDARVPNQVVSEAIDRGLLEEFHGFRVKKKEVSYGASRLDLLLEDSGQNRFYVEVKSVTLVRAGTALFPDAPTERGGRHISELVRAVNEGYRAAAVFLVQREDAREFSPNDATDPAFGAGLRTAAAAGVELYSYICRVTTEGIEIIRSVPVRI